MKQFNETAKDSPPLSFGDLQVSLGGFNRAVGKIERIHDALPKGAITVTEPSSSSLKRSASVGKDMTPFESPLKKALLNSSSTKQSDTSALDEIAGKVVKAVKVSTAGEEVAEETLSISSMPLPTLVPLDVQVAPEHTRVTSFDPST